MLQQTCNTFSESLSTWRHTVPTTDHTPFSRYLICLLISFLRINKVLYCIPHPSTTSWLDDAHLHHCHPPPPRLTHVYQLPVLLSSPTPFSDSEHRFTTSFPQGLTESQAWSVPPSVTAQSVYLSILSVYLRRPAFFLFFFFLFFSLSNVECESRTVSRCYFWFSFLYCRLVSFVKFRLSHILIQ